MERKSMINIKNRITFTKRKQLVQEFHEWAQKENEELGNVKVDESDLTTFIAFLQDKGYLDEKAILKTPESECKICSRKRGHEWDLLETDSFVGLNGGRDYDGKIYLAVFGEDEERYYPRYCPECGRKLHD